MTLRNRTKMSLGNNSPLPYKLSYQDQKIMQENGFEYDLVNKPESQVWWEIVAVEKEEASPDQEIC